MESARSCLSRRSPKTSDGPSFRERLEALAIEYEQLEETYHELVNHVPKKEAVPVPPTSFRKGQFGKVDLNGELGLAIKAPPPSSEAPSAKLAKDVLSVIGVDEDPATPSGRQCPVVPDGFAGVTLPASDCDSLIFLPLASGTCDAAVSHGTYGTTEESTSLKKEPRRFPEDAISSTLSSLFDIQRSIAINPYDDLKQLAVHMHTKHGEQNRSICEIIRFGCFKLVSSKAFDTLIVPFIMIDCVLIGLEAQDTLHPFLGDYRDILSRISTAISCLFVAELLLRFAAYGVIAALKLSTWIRCDTVLTVFTVLEMIADFADSSGHLDLSYFRLFRCMRLGRLSKVMVHIRSLWFLIAGLSASLETLLSTMILVSLISYGFAILGMELLPPKDLNHDTHYNELASGYFGNFSHAIMTLMQLATFDSVSAVYRPMVMNSDTPFVVAAYFGLYALIVSIALMNLITAVMVEVTERRTQDDSDAQRSFEESRKRKLIPKLKILFESMDDNDSGEVSWQEFSCAPEEVKNELKALLNSDNLEEIFHLIDDDDSGSVKIEEFFNSVLRATGENNSVLVAFQVSRLSKQMRKVLMMVVEIADALILRGPEESIDITESVPRTNFRASMSRYSKLMQRLDKERHTHGETRQ